VAIEFGKNGEEFFLKVADNSFKMLEKVKFDFFTNIWTSTSKKKPCSTIKWNDYF
jgi:hypothetical protein